MMGENNGENERERERIKERYRERIRERVGESETERQMAENEIEECYRGGIGFDGLNCLDEIIEHLLSSYVISIDPYSREYLICAQDRMKKSKEFLKSLENIREDFDRDYIQDFSYIIEVVGEKIREAARELEDVLDSRVSDQILSQSESGEAFQLVGDEQIPFLYSLSLEGIEQHVDDFIQTLLNIEKLFTIWFEEDDQSGKSVSKTWLISWVATKAATAFLGMKEDYIQELESLFPEQEYDDDLLINGLAAWWIKKIAAILMMEMEKEKEKEKEKEDEKAKDSDVVSSGVESAVNMVGLTHLFCKIRNYLLQEGRFRICSIVGMAGIGKTALAKKILQDPLIRSKFEFCIFVRVGPIYKPEDIIQAILAQIPDGDKLSMVGQMDMYDYLKETLKVKKCLIVLDDVWDRYFWIKLVSEIYDYDTRESGIFWTTRKNEVVKGRKYIVPFLSKELSWDLLRGKIFGKKGCPREFEKAGMKIAENCEGLPLLIVTVADLLSRAEKTPEFWSQIATDKTNSIFVGAYDQIYEVVYPSYSDLPRHLKVCFLYLGAFLQNDEICVSKLIYLWSADGFLGVEYTSLQRYVEFLVKEIVSNNVALGTQLSTTFDKLKACSLHSVFWYLCKREAWKEKFLLVLNSYKDVSVEGIESTRRLSIYKNAILIIKDVRYSIASMSDVRSILCTGLHHQYQVPIIFGLRLIKVLDALTIRFYEFPKEVLKLVMLRYLALTCNDNLPTSISKLWSLQSLIVQQQLNIKSSSISHSYLPVEIWNLQELEYLQITGRNLPGPPPSTVLSKLRILLDVGAFTCTKRVLESMPSLVKLKVQIELMPVASEPLRLFDDISHLRNVKSLQFLVVNPELIFDVVAPAPSFSASRVRKLTLSGLGYPWKDMNKIAELPHLEVLKLRCYAFRGKKWEVKESDFWALKYLSVEDTDLVHWTGVLRLHYLTIKNCYKLQEIPRIAYSREIRVVDCNPTSVASAQKMATSSCRVYVDSSWLADD